MVATHTSGSTPVAPRGRTSRSAASLLETPEAAAQGANVVPESDDSRRYGGKYSSNCEEKEERIRSKLSKRLLCKPCR